MSVTPETSGSAYVGGHDSAPATPRRSLQRFLDSFLLLVVLVVIWQLVYWKSEVAITGPIETVKTAIELLGSETFWRHALASGRAFGLSLLMSSIGGVAVGLALGAHRFSGAVAAPILTALYTIPKSDALSIGVADFWPRYLGQSCLRRHARNHPGGDLHHGCGAKHQPGADQDRPGTQALA